MSKFYPTMLAWFFLFRGSAALVPRNFLARTFLQPTTRHLSPQRERWLRVISVRTMTLFDGSERGDGEIETIKEEAALTDKDQPTVRTWEELLRKTNTTVAPTLDSSKQTEEQQQQQDMEEKNGDKKERIFGIEDVMELPVEESEKLRQWLLIQMEDRKLKQKVQDVIESTEKKIASIREKLAEDNKKAAELTRQQEDKLNKDKGLAIQMADAQLNSSCMKRLEDRIRIWTDACKKVEEYDKLAEKERRKIERMTDNLHAEEERQAKATQMEAEKIEQEFQDIVKLVEQEKANLSSPLEIDDKQSAELARMEEERLNRKIDRARLEADKQKARLLQRKELEKFNRWTEYRGEKTSFVADDVLFIMNKRGCLINAEKEEERQAKLGNMEDEKIKQERDRTLESIENERARIYSELEEGEKQRCELARLEEVQVCSEALLVLKTAKEERDGFVLSLNWIS